ncbi:DNA-binding transcriptional activator MarA, partial [Salmonella enterica subsp. enterica serovar Kentucky str. ATCC 9263]
NIDPDVQKLFDVPPHKYRITNMHGESRYMLPLNHGNY